MTEPRSRAATVVGVLVVAFLIAIALTLALLAWNAP